jgi:hypothetical protein
LVCTLTEEGSATIQSKKLPAVNAGGGKNVHVPSTKSLLRKIIKTFQIQNVRVKIKKKEIMLSNGTCADVGKTILCFVYFAITYSGRFWQTQTSNKLCHHACLSSNHRTMYRSFLHSHSMPQPHNVIFYNKQLIMSI